MPKKRGASRVLSAGAKGVLRALRTLASVGVASGDSYAALRNPSLWPHEVHEAVTDAWTTLTTGGAPFEVGVHVVAAALEEVKGLKLVPGFKVKLPPTEAGSQASFVKSTGKNPTLLRMRDFTDSLVLVTESTLARDASAAPLAKGKCKYVPVCCSISVRRHEPIPSPA